MSGIGYSETVKATTVKKSVPEMIVRADADAHIGVGHIMRCLALAQEWRVRGGETTFVSRLESHSLHQRIVDEGHSIVPIEKPCPDPGDLKVVTDKIAEAVGQGKTAPWVILDGYHFVTDYHRRIKQTGARLLVVDDTNHLTLYHADILLNQNINAAKLWYCSDEETVKLLGSRYTLLRKEFMTHTGSDGRAGRNSKRILVTMGGSDEENVTLKVIKALNSIEDSRIAADIVCGPTNPHFNNLTRELKRSKHDNRLLCHVADMSLLMERADIAISAGGSSCWEMAFMGLPAIVIVVAENQEETAAELGRYGSAINLGWHHTVSQEQLADRIQALLNSPKKRERMSAFGKKLIDGKGTERVADTMISLPVNETKKSQIEVQ